VQGLLEGATARQPAFDEVFFTADLVVALDAPALLCDADEFVDSDVLG
jgi:hypothetical protein